MKNLNNLGLSKSELFDMGIAKNLESTAHFINKNLELVKNNDLEHVLDGADIEHAAIIQTVAAMIDENNQRISEQLRKLGYLGE